MATRSTAQEEMLSTQEKLILTRQFIKIYWKILFAITWALILIPPLLFYNYPETRCAYTILVMAGYWITECFPMAVTSLIPLVLFPIFGILSTAATCACYMNDTIMVFIGGLVLAVAIEHSNLHLRIALGVMKTVGCTHRKLLGGLCVVTTFISMWVSNTAATAMMVPIIFAVLNELEQAGLCHVFEEVPIPPGSTDPPDVRDSTPVIFVSIMMFFIPKDLNFLRSYNKDPSERPVKSSEGLITWDVIQKKMPWSLMFLLGGGFAISRGSTASGLAKKIGETLVPLRYLPPILIMLFICLFIGTITEFTSNVGIANITLPVIAQMCVAMEIHPMYLMVPAAISCSYSFRLPVGTPPNAIISIVGQLPTKWLIIGGCGPSIFALIVNVTCFAIWGTLIFDVKGFPDWAKSSHPATGNP